MTPEKLSIRRRLGQILRELKPRFKDVGDHRIGQPGWSAFCTSHDINVRSANMLISEAINEPLLEEQHADTLIEELEAALAAWRTKQDPPIEYLTTDITPIYHANKSVVKRIVRKLLRWDYQDTVQDAWVQIAKQLARTGVTDNPQSLVSTIAFNEAARELRRRRRAPQILTYRESGGFDHDVPGEIDKEDLFAICATPAPDDEDARAEHTDRQRAALAKLPAEDRELLTRYVTSDTAELARQRGVTPHSLHNQIGRARKRLRQIFDQLD